MAKGGVGKERARIDFWFKNIAPSAELRRLYHTDAIDFVKFKKRYLIELAKYYSAYRDASKNVSDNPFAVIGTFLKNESKDITLLYGLKDEVNNNAVVLKEFIELRIVRFLCPIYL